MSNTRVPTAPRLGAFQIRAPDQRFRSQFLGLYSDALPALRPEAFERPAREARIEAALRATGVLTGGQLRRYFDADPEDLRHLATVRHAGVQPAHNRVLRVNAEFYALRAGQLTPRVSLLAHQVGAAELLLSLGVPPECWLPGSVVRPLAHAPDAAMRLNDGRLVAVEWDRGTYSARDVIAKMLSFGGGVPAPYAGVLWGVVSQTQLTNRRNVALGAPELRHVRLPALFMTAAWWRDEPVSGESLGGLAAGL